MSVITLREYAKTHNISYEAVRKQVARFQEELSEHIIDDGGQRFLDETAVAFLDSRRVRNPVVLANDGAKAELEAAKAALEEMRYECAKKDGKIEILQQQLIANAGAAALLEAAENREKVLQAKTEDLIRENAKLEDRAKEAKAEAAEIKAKYEKLKNRNIFQRIWNKE